MTRRSLHLLFYALFRPRLVLQRTALVLLKPPLLLRPSHIPLAEERVPLSTTFPHVTRPSEPVRPGFGTNEPVRWYKGEAATMTNWVKCFLQEVKTEQTCCR
ncbi:hypothetical protein CC2G_011915 [Coprinopsis cinerea AmutBmut pab1-1]|nr:hypothetical protein CC2G_011915 [Coprinopsis cinerea AmutBmut pab1-1]